MTKTKASFYILHKNEQKAYDFYVCHVIEKAYLDGYCVYVNVDSLEEAQNFDIKLWTFRDISFVPHEIYSQNSNYCGSTKVFIGFRCVPLLKSNNNKNSIFLVNLSVEPPEFYKQFDNIIEVVHNNEELKKHSRKKYVFYQKENLQIETINIT